MLGHVKNSQKNICMNILEMIFLQLRCSLIVYSLFEIENSFMILKVNIYSSHFSLLLMKTLHM